MERKRGCVYTVFRYDRPLFFNYFLLFSFTTNATVKITMANNI